VGAGVQLWTAEREAAKVSLAMGLDFDACQWHFAHFAGCAMTSVPGGLLRQLAGIIELRPTLL
jgi:hypothetical protein